MKKTDSSFGLRVLTPDYEVHMPRSHVKALKLDAHIVVGDRGSGKSYLTDMLKSEAIRGLLGRELPELQGMEVFIGFSNFSRIECYPDAGVFDNFCNSQKDYYDLWRAVILRWVAQKEGDTIPSKTWESTVEWLKEKPEDAAHVMERPRNWKGLILFDEMNSISRDFTQMDAIIRGLLRAILWLKGHPGLYGKVFLRTDQAGYKVFTFPDASKLFATQVKLTTNKVLNI